MKKSFLVALIVLLTSMLVVGIALAQVGVTDDTYVQQANPTDNFGGEETLRVRSGGLGACGAAELAYLKFDLSSVSEAATSNATLFVEVVDVLTDSDGSMHLYAVSDDLTTTGAWTEDNLDYSTADLPTGTSLAMVTVPAAVGQLEFTSQDLADYINQESAFTGGVDATSGDNVISFAIQIEGCTGFSNTVELASSENTTATQPAVVLSPTSVALTTANATGGSASWLLIVVAGLFVMVSIVALVALRGRQTAA